VGEQEADIEQRGDRDRSPLGPAFLASAATVGLTAAIADRVPDHQRGVVSGAVYGPHVVVVRGRRGAGNG